MQLNGVNLNIDDCNVTFSTDEVKITGFEDQIVATGRTPTGRTDGVDDFSGTLSGYVDASAMPASQALGFAYTGVVQGAYVLNVKLFLDKTVAPRYCGCTQCQIFRVNYMVKVNDAWKYSVEVKCAGGVIVHPT